jgi:dihydroxy-acid dehydratase
MRRVFLKSMGATDADLEKPLVAIANTWNEILPGSYHLDRITAAVKRGIQDAGGMACPSQKSLPFELACLR